MIRILTQSTFARNVGLLVGGTASAQLLLILASPLLTRLYTPNDYGVLAVYAGILGIFSVIASLRYELAITLPENDQEAANIVALCLLVVLLMTVLTAILVFFFGQYWVQLLDAPVLAPYTALLPIGVLLTGSFSVFNFWAIRTKHFENIAKTKFWQSLVTLAIQLGAFRVGFFALLIGQITGQSSGTIRLGKAALIRSEFKTISWQGIKKVAKRYRNFPLYASWSGIINTLGHQVLPLLLAAFFSVGVTGLYVLAHRILMMPVSLVSSAIGNVFLAHASEARWDNKLPLLFRKTLDLLMQVAMPPALLFIFVAPNLFEVVFGAEWRQAGEYAQLLVFGIFAAFVVSPLSSIFTIIEKQGIGLLLQCLLFISRLAAILIGVRYNDISLALILYSLASFFCYGLYPFIAALYIKFKIRFIAFSFIKSLFYSIVTVWPIIIVSDYPSTDLTFWYVILVTIVFIIIRYKYLVINFSYPTNS